MLSIKVNDKQVIKTYTYYHCFKLSESSYALFDAKMNMPIVIGSLSVIKSTKISPNSVVFLYSRKSQFLFEKGAKKTIELGGSVKHTKPPLRYHYIDDSKLFYNHFKLSGVLSVLFDDDFHMPIAYGSNQKIQAILNKISKQATVYYYKEDASIKHSFKMFMTYESKN